MKSGKSSASGKARGVLPYALALSLSLALLPMMHPTPRTGTLRGVTGHQHWATVLCKFADVPDEPQDAAFFEDMFERTDGPSLNSYWDEVSYGKLSVSTDVYGWYGLPHPRAHYSFPGFFFAWALIQDCVDAADADVDFGDYQGVAVMVNSPSPIVMWTKMFTPPDGAHLAFHGLVLASNKWTIAVGAHEMGHAYLMPRGIFHSYAGGEIYQNPWDVMGIPSAYNCALNEDPVYGCLGQHPLACLKYRLGWLEPHRVFDAPSGRHTITLERLAQPPDQGVLLAWVPIDGKRGYAVEARRRVGYDAKLAGDAVIIHRVSPDPYPGSSGPGPCGGAVVDLVDVDGPPYDDDGAMWTVGETFTDPAHGISIHVDAATATGFVITIDKSANPTGLPTEP
jgi:M6 family metalloprotease-like protein